MIKQLCLAVLLIPLFTSLCCGDYIIKLKKTPMEIIGQSFYIDSIIDSRVDKDNIGTARTGGPLNIKSKVNLKGGFKAALMKFISISFPKSGKTTPIALNILYFNVDETSVFMNEKAEARAIIEYYAKRSDKYEMLYKTDTYVKHVSKIDCTKYHEPNIREALKRSFIEYVSSGVDPKGNKPNAKLFTKNEILARYNPGGAQNAQEKDRKIYYEYKWKGTGELELFYGAKWQNILLQYKRETALSHVGAHTNIFGYSAGYSRIDNADLEEEFAGGIKQNGKYSADIYPVTLCFCRKVKSKAWGGKWGIGLTGYYYSGTIDLKPPDAMHTGSGMGMNIVFPGEILYKSGKSSNWIFRINYELQIPLTKNRYSAPNSTIEAYAYQGVHAGISIGKYWE